MAGVGGPWGRGRRGGRFPFRAGGAVHLGEDDAYLAAARRLAGLFLDACGPELVAPWDFDAAGRERIPDSSASAIAAAGLLALAGADGDSRWREAALAILAALEARCATDAGAGQEGLLGHACYHYPAGRGLAESVAWGDFFYLDALSRAAGGRGLYDLA